MKFVKIFWQMLIIITEIVYGDSNLDFLCGKLMHYPDMTKQILLMFSIAHFFASAHIERDINEAVQKMSLNRHSYTSSLFIQP